MRLNNAYILALNRYHRDLSLFGDLHRSLGGDLGATVSALKGLKRWRGDPKAYVETMLEAQLGG